MQANLRNLENHIQSMSDQSQLTAIALKKSGGLKSNPSVKSINSKKKLGKANN